MILAAQIVVLIFLMIGLVLWIRAFPYPSPLIRPLLPARKRWPETQIRNWLKNGGFHRGYLAFFYRDPPRTPPQKAGFVAPADGPITSLDTRGTTRYVVIALSFWDMHTQRSPIDGIVRAVQPSGDCHTDGEGRDFAFLRAKHCPVQTRIVLDTVAGEIAVRLITSVAARRIETWVEPGQSIERGQRIGRILLGSTVVLELPVNRQIAIPIGQRVHAGETWLAPASEP